MFVQTNVNYKKVFIERNPNTSCLNVRSRNSFLADRTTDHLLQLEREREREERERRERERERGREGKTAQVMEQQQQVSHS